MGTNIIKLQQLTNTNATKMPVVTLESLLVLNRRLDFLKRYCGKQAEHGIAPPYLAAFGSYPTSGPVSGDQCQLMTDFFTKKGVSGR